MVEILAAAASAAIGGAAMGLGVMSSRARENREVIIRLSIGMENIAARLEQLHVDMKADRGEVFNRLATLEQRTSRLEVLTEQTQ
jgi:hypothetical protein